MAKPTNRIQGHHPAEICRISAGDGASHVFRSWMAGLGRPARGGAEAGSHPRMDHRSRGKSHPWENQPKIPWYVIPFFCWRIAFLYPFMGFLWDFSPFSDPDPARFFTRSTAKNTTMILWVMPPRTNLHSPLLYNGGHIPKYKSSYWNTFLDARKWAISSVKPSIRIELDSLSRECHND